MSDEFLNKCLPKDLIPGLKKTQHEKREHEIMKRKAAISDQEKKLKKQRLNINEYEAQVREEGLSKKLDNSNKGFAMLAKMGYKEGTSLGKGNQGRVDPVEVVLKKDKSGLGRESAIKLIAEKKCRILAQKAKECVENFDPSVFRAQMREKHMIRRCEADLFKAQKSCRELDEKKDFSEPVEQWFWPKIVKPVVDEETEEDEEEEEEDPFSPFEKLEMLITYIRAEHYYCLYCGINFDDSEDMTQNCPGPNRDDHDDM